MLSLLLFWAIYNAFLLFVGISEKHEHHTESICELPKISLIVPVKNEGAVMRRCLDSLLSIDYPKDMMEIIIVDGDSRDETREICDDFARKDEIIKVFCEQTARGKPAALNFALTHATGKIVGVFDADSIPERNVLLRVAAYFQNAAVTAVQGKTNSLNAKQNMLTRMADMEERMWFEGQITAKEKLGLFVPITGSCVFIRLSVLKEIGGWRETALAEDLELALELVEKGHSVRYCPDVCCRQETPSSLSELAKQRTRWNRGYMEASFRYGALLLKPSRKHLDAEISLLGPFMMIMGFLGYVNWVLSLWFPSDGSIALVSSVLAIVLLTVTLLSLGLSAFLVMKPTKLNIFWFPFLSLYWFLLMGIACNALLLIVFRRPKKWTRTAKKGVVIAFG